MAVVKAIALLLISLFLLSQSSQAQQFFGSNRFVVTERQQVYRGPRVEEAMLRPEVRRTERPDIVTDGVRGPTVRGNRAVVRRGIAYAPENAPESVKRLIWSVNNICRAPYKWGGGHGSFNDSGYDCSGTISYALHHGGVLRSPLTSRNFREWGQRGRGRWVTVYARNGHTFAVVAGLRLDAMGMSSRQGPRWHSDMRSTQGFTARSHPAL